MPFGLKFCVASSASCISQWSYSALEHLVGRPACLQGLENQVTSATKVSQLR